jgi:hypothetical protein
MRERGMLSHGYIWEHHMRRLSAAAVVVGVLFGAGAASAAECYPYCDYIHDYGPFDYTWVRPGMFAYPVCDWRGNCAPRYAYVFSGQRGRVTVRTRRQH